MNNRAVFKYFFVVALVVLLSACRYARADDDAAASLSTNCAPNSAIAGVVLPHLLVCVSKTNDVDAVVTRTWAFMLLDMSWHANESLQWVRESLQPLEVALFEGAIGRQIAYQNSEEMSLLSTYLPLVGQSNVLLKMHLSNLGAVGGGGIVTNVTSTSVIDLTPFPLDPNKATVVVSVSEAWIIGLCSNGHCDQLIDQLRLVGLFRNQAGWQVIVLVSQHQEKEAIDIHIMRTAEKRPTNSRIVLMPTDDIFHAKEKERRRMAEDIVLRAIEGFGSHSD